jgi:hypothetical protein
MYSSVHRFVVSVTAPPANRTVIGRALPSWYFTNTALAAAGRACIGETALLWDEKTPPERGFRVMRRRGPGPQPGCTVVGWVHLALRRADGVAGSLVADALDGLDVAASVAGSRE